MVGTLALLEHDLLLVIDIAVYVLGRCRADADGITLPGDEAGELFHEISGGCSPERMVDVGNFLAFGLRNVKDTHQPKTGKDRHQFFFLHILDRYFDRIWSNNLDACFPLPDMPSELKPCPVSCDTGGTVLLPSDEHLVMEGILPELGRCI